MNFCLKREMHQTLVIINYKLIEKRKNKFVSTRRSCRREVTGRGIVFGVLLEMCVGVEGLSSICILFKPVIYTTKNNKFFNKLKITRI